MAATTSHLSLEEFHRIYDGVKPNHEYWYGEAIPKSMPSILHSAVQTALILLLFSRGWKVFPEATLKMGPDAALVPDLIATRGVPDLPYPTHPVEICIEILSPEDRLKKAVDKGKRYLDWGVSYVWIINPVERTAWMLTSENPEGIWMHPDGKLTAGEDTEIPLSELFAEVDKLLPA
jgi:Uma2 family endonuclease